MTKIRLRLLSTLYLFSLFVSVPLLWCTSLSMRVQCKRAARFSTKRRLQLLRVLAKHSALDLGSAVVWFMAVPAAFAGSLGHSVAFAALGAAVGFVAMALIPVMMPAPSRELADAAATGRRFV
jgi:hypothetical protein